MNDISRKEIAELVGIAAIVASLIFVGMQMRQAQDIAMAEGYSSVFATRIEVNNSIKEHVDIWKKGVAEEELQEEESAVFALLVTQVNESAIQAHLQALMVEGEDSAKFAARDFASFLYHNPGARKVWEEREEYLEQSRGLLGYDNASESWTETVKTFLSKLDSSQPPSDEKPFVDW